MFVGHHGAIFNTKYKKPLLIRFKDSMSDWRIIVEGFIVIFILLVYLGPMVLMLEDVLHNLKLKRESEGIDGYFCGYSDTNLIYPSGIDIHP